MKQPVNDIIPTRINVYVKLINSAMAAPIKAVDAIPKPVNVE